MHNFFYPVLSVSVHLTRISWKIWCKWKFVFTELFIKRNYSEINSICQPWPWHAAELISDLSIHKVKPLSLPPHSLLSSLSPPFLPHSLLPPSLPPSSLPSPLSHPSSFPPSLPPFLTHSLPRSLQRTSVPHMERSITIYMENQQQWPCSLWYSLIASNAQYKHFIYSELYFCTALSQNYAVQNILPSTTFESL